MLCVLLTMYTELTEGNTARYLAICTSVQKRVKLCFLKKQNKKTQRSLIFLNGSYRGKWEIFHYLGIT